MSQSTATSSNVVVRRAVCAGVGVSERERQSHPSRVSDNRRRGWNIFYKSSVPRIINTFLCHSPSVVSLLQFPILTSTLGGCSLNPPENVNW